MANIIEQIGGSMSSFGWGGVGNIAFIVSIVLGTVIFLLFVLLFIWWKSFYINVKIYEPYGQIALSEEDIEKIKKESKEMNTNTLKRHGIKFDMIRKKKTHGKYVTLKGSPFFQIFMPLIKIEPVIMEHMYNDGIHLLRLSKNIFVPIPKPRTIIDVGEAVSISIKDNNQWQTWNNIMADRINNKYQDVDAQKKAIMYFVVGIVALVLVGGFIIWLIYSSATKGLDAADKFNAVARSLTEGKPV